MDEYAYPTGISSTYRGGWWLRPGAVCSNAFQEDISDTLNDEENYANFHQQLRTVAGHDEEQVEEEDD